MKGTNNVGCTTYFSGEVTVTPPLNDHEIAYLQRFADSRRMHRTKGPYYTEPGDNRGQSDEGVLDYNEPPQQQPGLWCHWIEWLYLVADDQVCADYPVDGRWEQFSDFIAIDLKGLDMADLDVRESAAYARRY